MGAGEVSEILAKGDLDLGRRLRGAGEEREGKGPGGGPRPLPGRARSPRGGQGRRAPPRLVVLRQRAPGF